MRLYTIDEARAVLPAVIRLLEQLTRSLSELQALEKEVFSERGRADRKSTRLNSSHGKLSRMPSSA